MAPLMFIYHELLPCILQASSHETRKIMIMIMINISILNIYKVCSQLILEPEISVILASSVGVTTSAASSLSATAAGAAATVIAAITEALRASNDGDSYCIMLIDLFLYVLHLRPFLSSPFLGIYRYATRSKLASRVTQCDSMLE